MVEYVRGETSGSNGGTIDTGVIGAACQPRGDTSADTMAADGISPMGHMEGRHLVSVLLEKPTTNMGGILNIVCYLGVCRVKGEKSKIMLLLEMM